MSIRPGAPRGDGPAAGGTGAELETPLLDVCARIRAAVLAATEGGATEALSAVVGAGAGDRTFGIDVVAERAAEKWFEESARRGPLSLLTEDAGWRHAGPDGPLDGFDHGGPRVVLDPIDGTRHLMHDLRPAWVVAGAAPPGPGAPRLGDLAVGALAELPCRGAARARELAAVRGGGARIRETALGTVASPTPWSALRVGGQSARLDGGFLPFFGFEPRCRAAAQALAARVFARLEAELGIDPESVLDDQYISSGGQLALLALGTYHAVVDARVSLGRAHGLGTRTAKPYDVAGAILVAEEAGAVVAGLDGAPLDFPLDAETPVEFAGYANRATADVLGAAVRAELTGPAASG
ncbi:MAG: inositol monophosphatase family protein [Planctomycetota bacterium]